MNEYINLQTAKENIVSLTTYNGEEEIRQAVKSARYKEDQWIGGIYDALISLNEIPAADMVEVVRCKDCTVPHNHWTGCPRMNGTIMRPDDYCSYGERKEG